MQRIRDAARYADQQPLSNARRFTTAIAGSVAVAVAMGTVGLFALVSGDPDDRSAAAGLLAGAVAFLVLPTALVIHFSNRYRAHRADRLTGGREDPSTASSIARLSSTGWLLWLFIGALALIAIGIWQVLGGTASTGAWLIVIAVADVALVVAMVRRADRRQQR